ncbi:MAG: PorT family protein [Flavobacteriaceae bacterium]|jgi:hypothetical protein|nr:PorT family protein [Flavobacteriaceae bacterium]
MKKIVLSVLAIGAFAFTANAQTPDIKLGAKAGVNFSNLSNFDDSKMKTGFHVGALAEIFINEKFAIQPELLYSTQGVKGKSGSGISGLFGQKVDATLKLDYINIPIMAKYYVMDGLSVHAGPQVGFLVKGEMELKSGGDKATKDIKDQCNSVDFGLNFGAGYELPMGVFFDARYNLGLTKVLKDSNESVKNGVFQLSVGYKF